jgi:hypothetical protein
MPQWPNNSMNINLDVNGGSDLTSPDTASGANSQTQSPPGQGGGQQGNFAMAGNVFLGAGTPRGGF